MRHAKAVPAHEAETDEARGLTAQGRSDAAESARRLFEAGHAPLHALVSPAERTRQTAEIVAERFPALAVSYEPRLYMADPDEILRVAMAQKSPALIVIGHNPGLQILASDLLDQAADRSRLAQSLRARFTTSCFAAFKLSGDSLFAPGPELIDAFTPRD